MPLYNPIPDIASYIASKMSGNTPLSESTSGAPGGSGLIPQSDHSHPRVTSSDIYTISSGSTVTTMFTRTFTKKPGVFHTLIEASTVGQQPVLFAVVDWLAADGTTSLGINPADGTVIGGCVTKAWRARVVPQNLVSALVGAVYDLFGGTLGSISFTCIAVASSKP